MKTGLIINNSNEKIQVKSLEERLLSKRKIKGEKNNGMEERNKR